MPVLCTAVFILSVSAAGAQAPGGDNDWPQFRGPNASGVARTANPPTAWDAATSKNIKWKTPIPGLARSSPIVWRDRIYVVTAVASSGTPTVVAGDSSKAGIDPANDMVSHTWRLLAIDIYLASDDGSIVVAQAGPSFALLSTNAMGEILMATPAITGDMLIVRTRTQLIGISS
jgi:hypothetical protein